jgi:hypothetical protein
LKFEVVNGAQAKTDSPAENFTATAHYIKVYLAHPVSERGEYRLAIIKTYKDDKSYYTEGDQIVLKRPLGIPRDSIVLPAGFEIVSCSVATQVLREADGRLKLAFVNPGSGGQLEVTIRARKLTPTKSLGASSTLLGLFSLTPRFSGVISTAKKLDNRFNGFR